jgi:hypothetical protein
MTARITAHLRSNVIAYLALFLALGGASALAAGKLNGKQIKPRSIPGNRLKPNTVTGRQVKESSLATVPKSQLADSSANADNSAALGGKGVAEFGSGVVNGGIDSPQNGASFRTPYGVTVYLAPGSGLEAIAPSAIRVRDFEARWVTNFDSDDTLVLSMQVNNGTSIASVPLCTIIGTAAGLDCRAAGPVNIPSGALYKLELSGSGLEGNEQATFAYRLAAG